MTKLMGILNVTPDSFYDKGRFANLEAAISRGREMHSQGADIIDVGGESTRPGAAPVSEEQELKRVIPVITALAGLKTQISIDTRHPKVAQEAVRAGATLINDVTGFTNSEMQKIAKASGVEICVMHMQGNPQTMQHKPAYPEGVMTHLMNWFHEHIEKLLDIGIKKKQIILDPGIGFGKTVDDNLEIIQNLPVLKSLGFPLLFGISRKSFMSAILDKPSAELLPATLAINALLISSKVDIVRVHDVSEHRQVIDVLKKLKT